MKKEIEFRSRNAIRVGLVGGATALLIALVGMVEAFADRYIITGVISMGQVLLFSSAFVVGYYAAGRTTSDGWQRRVWNAALAGLAAGAVLAGLVLLMETVDLRPVLVNASPALLEILTFGLDTLPGIVLLLVVNAVVAALACLMVLLPARARRTVMTGLGIVILGGLLQDILRLALAGLPPVATALAWMFAVAGQTGLSVAGATVLFAVVAGGNYWWADTGPRFRGRLRELPPQSQRNVRLGSWALVAVSLLVLPALIGTYLSDVADTVGIFMLLGLGLNIVVGFAGLLDLGYVAFFGIGAYAMGVLTTTSGQIVFAPQLAFWQALPIAIAVSILAGIVLGIPVLKTRGDYLAIVTLGFGEIIRILALSDWLKPYLGGSQGIVAVAKPTVGNVVISTPQGFYYLIMIGCVIAAFIAIRLKDSRIGRSWMGVREDEDVAQAMGITLTNTKLMAFATGAALAGLSGAIFASKVGSIYPHSLTLLISINALAIVIVGGMGSVPGVVVGALALAGLPELLREFAEFRLWVFGAVLVAMMLLRPEGLVPEATRRRELHEEEILGQLEPIVEAEPVSTAAADTTS